MGGDTHAADTTPLGEPHEDERKRTVYKDSPAEDRQHVVALPTNRAFVVQFCRSGRNESDTRLGRVEHLVSGQSRQFESWGELQQFIEQVLAQCDSKPQ